MADEEPIIIKVKGIKIKLQPATINCSELFADGLVETQDDNTVKEIYKLKHSKTSRVVDLDPLESLRAGKREYLLPRKVFVRNCMQEVFNYLVTTQDDMHTVVLGSPGVGKSLLSFLAAIQIALIKEDKTVLFLRKTKNRNERISVFLMTKSKTKDNIVEVYFNRKVPNFSTYTLCDIYEEIVFSMEQEAEKDGREWSDENLRTFVDGPNYKEKNDRPVLSSLVTSGGYRGLKQEERSSNQLLALSAWSIEEIREGMKALHHVPEKIVDIIYDTVGGSYRAAFDTVNSIRKNGQTQLHNGVWDDIKVDSKIVRDAIETSRDEFSDIDRVLGKISASVSGSILDGDSIDILRAMYATMKHNGKKVVSKVTQFLASAYLARRLRSKITLESLQIALERAKHVHGGACYGWHFEHFGHMIFHRLSDALKKNEDPQNPGRVPQIVNPFEVVEGEVSKLDQFNLYWTPGIPNFANIDAAIALDEVLYCLQYTISSDRHTFNYNTFVSKFWDELQEKFKSQIQTIKVVFVLPEKQDSNKNDSYQVSLGEKKLHHEFFRTEEGIVLKPKAPTEEGIVLKPDAPEAGSHQTELEEPPTKKQKGIPIEPIERIELTKEFLSEKYELNNPPLPFMKKKNAGQ